MTLDQKQKQFWNRHAKRNKNPRDPNVSVLLGAFLSRSNISGPPGGPVGQSLFLQIKLVLPAYQTLIFIFFLNRQ